MTATRSFKLIAAASAFAVVLALGYSQGDAPKKTDPPVVRSRAQIEADWLRQDEVRGRPGSLGQVTPVEDAAGGCDGVKDGKWGFHTALEDNPWWQVDLGREIALDQVLIYNRADQVADRAARLLVLLSGDGKNWQKVYQHDGRVFHGAPDSKPLAVELKRGKARFVRIQLPGKSYFHLDEVEVYATSGNYQHNVALNKRATQSSTSQWSKRSPTVTARSVPGYPTAQVVEQGLRLADDLRGKDVDVADAVRALAEVRDNLARFTERTPAETRRAAYLAARWAVRQLALKNPLLDFDHLLFAKRVPTSYAHMSDQNYGWFSRPGGGVFVLENFKSETPHLRCLTSSLPPGSVLQPELSYDGTRVLFAYCRHYPHVADIGNKLDKSKIPEDAFYHLYEVNLDGTGLRRLTQGKYDDFDGRYLPSGEILFLSTRRGQAVQTGKHVGPAGAEEPDCYVRCGGGSWRPVAVYTLHVMDVSGGNLRAISPFENFEWTPNVADDGRILYSRWDYIDRDNMPYMKLWSTQPDGTAAQAIFGNYTISPYATFEPRSVPGSHKIVATASAHHSITGGSLILLDPHKAADGPGPITRLTPEVPFPEIEGVPSHFYSSPYPLSEQHHLTAWSDQPLVFEGGRGRQMNAVNGMGLYLYDAFGNLTLLYRDPDISSLYPIPVKPRHRPPVLGSPVRWEEREGRMLLLDVYTGLYATPRGSVKNLRLVGVPAKTQPTMNDPPIGLTHDDPGKFVLGTVPVEADGSAYFRVPAGVPFFVQALDGEGLAVQTMRSVTYVQPGQTYSCVGCHEYRHRSPAGVPPLAARREPSQIAPGPAGSWPLDFDTLVQPVLDQHCVRCHKPGAKAKATDLTAGKAYETLVSHGDERSLRNHVLTRYRQGRSPEGESAARTSAVFQLLRRGHHNVRLGAEDVDRLVTWMDTYAQRRGSFSEDQERSLRELRRLWAPLLTQRD